MMNWKGCERKGTSHLASQDLCQGLRRTWQTSFRRGDMLNNNVIDGLLNTEQD